MLRKFLGFAVAGCCTALPALAQTPPLDAKDPSITKKVTMAPKQTSYPEYPAAARRAGESGETVISTCVAVDGSSSKAIVAKSSGSEALDQAAIDWLNKGAAFLPAEVNGKRVAVCNYQFTYVWTLKQAPSVSPAAVLDDYLKIASLLPSDRPTAVLPATPPPYPETERATGAKGVVSMAFCISSEGRVMNFEIRKLEPGPNFIEPSLRYFLGSKFKPGTPSGKPTGVCGLELSYEWKAPK